MARLNIEQKRGKFAMNIPHNVLINGQLVGMMKDKRVAIEMPLGEYDITIQSMIPIISATQHVSLSLQQETTLVFSDREQFWDALFVVDVVLWCVKFFLHLTKPWTWLYEIFTNGYFVIWLFYEWRIRNKYFRFEIH